MREARPEKPLPAAVRRLPFPPSTASPLMETAVYSAASLFHGAVDSDDDRDEMQVSAEGKKPVALEYETAVFSAASLFHGADDSDDDRDEMQVSTEGKKPVALEYVERAHDFPGMKLCVREFSCHELNANLLWPGTFSFATWLVKNQSILDGRRVLELGREIEENIAYNCRANTLDVLPHIRHTWGDPFPVSGPDWDIVIASDILLYVKQYDNLIKTVSFLLNEYKQNGHKAGCITITNKSGTQIPAKSPVFLMSWRRRIGKENQSLFFNGCEKAGMEVQHLGDLVYLISNKA